MDKHYTIMIVPEKEKGVRSFKVPGIVVRALSAVFVISFIMFGIFVFDYWSIIKQISDNKHLDLENRQLKQQIQGFQNKINRLTGDLQRIRTFENKLRIITGLKDVRKSAPIIPTDEDSKEIMMDDHSTETAPPVINEDSVRLDSDPLKDLKDYEKSPGYIELKRLYDKKIAANFGLTEKYKITRKFSDRIKKSFELSSDYAAFDYKFRKVKSVASELEKQIHNLDQHLLDKESILRSTPTILPTNGWITSYFGHRISPTAGVRKMHEGLDVGAPYGTPILAPADGIVTFAGNKAGFGLFVQVDHGYGIETIYAHSQKIIAKNGQRVKRGDLLAKVGNTGASTGPHLHYEVRVNGVAVDPLYFVLN